MPRRLLAGSREGDEKKSGSQPQSQSVQLSVSTSPDVVVNSCGNDWSARKKKAKPCACESLHFFALHSEYIEQTKQQ